MFVVCNWLEKQLGYEDFPYTDNKSYDKLQNALEAIRSGHYNVLFRYRNELDYVFFDFKKEEFIEWIYETGRDEPNILESGSTYYNVVQFRNLEDAMKAYKEPHIGRNYLIRKIKINKQYHIQYYDDYLNMFIETR